MLYSQVFDFHFLDTLYFTCIEQLMNWNLMELMWQETFQVFPLILLLQSSCLVSMYVSLSPLQLCSLLSLSHSLSFSLGSSEAWLGLLLSYQKNAATADFNGAEKERAKKGFLFKKLSYNSDALLYWHTDKLLRSSTWYIIHFEMFCTNSLNSSNSVFILVECNQPMQMYCCALKNAIRLVYLSKIPIW